MASFFASRAALAGTLSINEKRLTAPLIRKNGKQEAGTWEEALEIVVDRLKGVMKEHGPAFGRGDRLEPHDQRRELSARPLCPHGDRNQQSRSPSHCGLLFARGSLDRGESRSRYATIEDIGAASSILVIGNDPTHQHPLIAYQIRQAVRQHEAHLYLLNSDEIKLERQAKLSVRVPAGKEAEAIRTLAGKVISFGLNSRRCRNNSEKGIQHGHRFRR